VLKKYAEKWAIPTDHFDPARCIEGKPQSAGAPVGEGAGRELHLLKAAR